MFYLSSLIFVDNEIFESELNLHRLVYVLIISNWCYKYNENKIW